MPKASSKVEVVVTVNEKHRPRIDEIAAHLASAGLTGPQVLKSAGIITGRAAPGMLDRLRTFAGIDAIEQSEEVHIAPPDSDVQ